MFQLLCTARAHTLAGLLSLYKIGTEGYPTASEHAYLAQGAPALRRLTTTTAAGVNRKELPKHPLVAEAVAYWQGALDIVNEANSANVASQVRFLFCVGH